MLVKCHNCQKEFNVKPSRIKAGRGKFCSKKCIQRPNISGKRNPFWKEKVSYIGIHQWLKRTFDPNRQALS